MLRRRMLASQRTTALLEARWSYSLMCTVNTTLMLDESGVYGVDEEMGEMEQEMSVVLVVLFAA